MKKKERRILVLVPNFIQIGGVSNYYRNLELNRFDGIDYFFVNSGINSGLVTKILNSLKIYFDFFLKVAFGSYKVVHVNPSLDKKSFYRDAVFIFIATLFAKKIIVFFRGWEDEFEKAIKTSAAKTSIFKRTYCKAHIFIVLGQTFKNKLLGLGVSQHLPFKIETTLSDDQFLDRLNIDEKIAAYNEEIVFLFLSRVEKTKGVFIAIDAFVEASNKLKDRKMRLLIAGEGNALLEAENYITTKKASNISSLGSVSGTAKGDVLINSHVLLFPTYFGEGMPNCILEGMLYGMPIISRINAAISDVVKDGENGFITSSLDPNVFATYITTLATDRELFAKMSKLNHQVAKDRFVKAKVQERILAVYDEA